MLLITPTRFRALLALDCLLLLLEVAAMSMTSGYSPALAEAYFNEPQPWLMGWFMQAAKEFLWLPILLVSAAIVASYAGLFLFKPWGRTLSLLLTVFGIALGWFMGPTLWSPLEAVLLDLSNLLWGALLALAYCSPASDYFKPIPHQGTAMPENPAACLPGDQPDKA